MPADLADRTDFDNANRGLIARLEPGVIKTAEGRAIWDIDAYGMATQGECPPTVDPSLWRQAKLTAIQGLFEVTGRVYQVRGADLSNMTLVETDNGVIVIDPLVSEECARAAIGLYREHRGDRQVVAVIWSTPYRRTSTPAPRCCAAACTTRGRACRSARRATSPWAWARRRPTARSG